MKMFRQNKKAWLRIMEAFLAVLLILSVLLVIISRQKADYNKQEEIMILQAKILEVATHDENLRNQLLNNDTSGVNVVIESLIPSRLNYTTRICNYKDICSLGYILDKNIYADEALIVANITQYSAENSTKLKIFLWEK